ncbi:hypothetical protein ES703_07481 [subsurface metagenome]
MQATGYTTVRKESKPLEEGLAPSSFFGLDIAGEPLILRQKEAVMLNIGLLALTLCGGLLVQPFRIAEAEPGHHQGYLRTAMAPDGDFAVAWVDYLLLSDRHGLDLYIRFFDRDGNPLTDAYKITKMVDTTRIGGSHLDMDSAGNTVLIWTEYPPRNPDETLLRLQLFDSSGNPLGSHQTEYQGYMSTSNRAVGSSLNDQGEFAVAWDVGGEIYARRYSFEGSPQGDPFRVHDDLPDDVGSHYPCVALNDAGDLVVTWLEGLTAKHLYPRFQVFDAEDESILPWEPMGHRIDDGEDEQYHGSRPEVHWLDDDRFVVFWGDWSTYRPVGRVFSDRGLTRHPIRAVITEDSLWCAHGGPQGWYSTTVAPNDSFAYTHIRSYTDYPDTSDPSKLRWWDHGGGILEYIQDNEPIRRTTLFEYTPPWGADTVNSLINNYPRTQPPAVACCDDRLVWVYCRLNTDTIFEAWAIITDWDMGIGIVESLSKIVSPIQLSASLNRLAYDVPGEARLTLYSADGRMVLEETIKGEGIWQAPSLPSGVYFVRVEGGSSSRTQKVVLIR